MQGWYSGSVRLLWTQKIWHTHELWLDPWRMMLGIHLLSGASVLTAHCCSEVTLARLMPRPYYIHRVLKNHESASGHSVGQHP